MHERRTDERTVGVSLRRAADLATVGAKPLPQTGDKVTLLRDLVIDMLQRVLAA